MSDTTEKEGRSTMLKTAIPTKVKGITIVTRKPIAEQSKPVASEIPIAEETKLEQSEQLVSPPPPLRLEMTHITGAKVIGRPRDSGNVYVVSDENKNVCGIYMTPTAAYNSVAYNPKVLCLKLVRRDDESKLDMWWDDEPKKEFLAAAWYAKVPSSIVKGRQVYESVNRFFAITKHMLNV